MSPRTRGPRRMRPVHQSDAANLAEAPIILSAR